MRDIVVLLFSDVSENNPSIVFQNWGIFKTHPRFSQIFEYTNDASEFNTVAKRFAVSNTPTVVFTQIVQENPLKIQPVTRIEGAFTTENLETIFNRIVDGTIPIPPEGNQGTKVDGNGNVTSKVDGGGGKGFGGIYFGLPSLFWGILAIWSGKKALDAPSVQGQVGYGGLSAYSASKAFNIKSK